MTPQARLCLKNLRSSRRDIIDDRVSLEVEAGPVFDGQRAQSDSSATLVPRHAREMRWK